MAIDYPAPPSYVTQFLMSDEGIVVALRRHPVQLLRPLLVLLLTTAFVFWLGVRLGAENSAPSLIWLIWLGVFLHTLYRVWWWRRDWLVVTNKRLVTQSGIFSRSMPMMPLQKITDMSYRRSPLGLLLGYGNFVLESAGQNQALREVRFVPRPDAVYQAMIEEVFRGPGTASQAEHTSGRPHHDHTALRDIWRGARSRLKNARSQLKKASSRLKNRPKTRVPRPRQLPKILSILLGRPHHPTAAEEIEALARRQGSTSPAATEHHSTDPRKTSEIDWPDNR